MLFISILFAGKSMYVSSSSNLISFFEIIFNGNLVQSGNSQHLFLTLLLPAKFPKNFGENFNFFSRLPIQKHQFRYSTNLVAKTFFFYFWISLKRSILYGNLLFQNIFKSLKFLIILPNLTTLIGLWCSRRRILLNRWCCDLNVLSQLFFKIYFFFDELKELITILVERHDCCL